MEGTKLFGKALLILLGFSVLVAVNYWAIRVAATGLSTSGETAAGKETMTAEPAAKASHPMYELYDMEFPRLVECMKQGGKCGFTHRLIGEYEDIDKKTNRVYMKSKRVWGHTVGVTVDRVYEWGLLRVYEVRILLEDGTVEEGRLCLRPYMGRIEAELREK